MIMARLNNRISCDSDDDEFPDLSTILSVGKGKSEGRGGTAEKEQGRIRVQHGIIESPKSMTKVSCDEKRLRKQRPLGLAHVNSFLLPIAKEPGQKNVNRDEHLDSRRDEIKRSTSRKAVKERVDHRASSTTSTTSSGDDVFFDDLSGFIVKDSASDLEEPPLRTRKPRRELAPIGEKVCSRLKPTVVDLTSPKKSSNVKYTSQGSEVAGTIFDEDPNERLKLYALHYMKKWSRLT